MGDPVLSVVWAVNDTHQVENKKPLFRAENEIMDVKCVIGARYE